MPYNSSQERIVNGLRAMAGRKRCRLCKVSKLWCEFHWNTVNTDRCASYCKDCQAITVRARHYKNPLERKNYRLRSKYGITLADYNALLAQQQGVCAVCGYPPTTEILVVDHNHDGGTIRGLLHRTCNLFIGWAQDNPDVLRRGILYLSKFKDMQ